MMRTKKGFLVALCLVLLYVLLVIFIPVVAKATRETNYYYSLNNRGYFYSKSISEDDYETIINRTQTKIYTSYYEENNQYYDDFEKFNRRLFIIIENYDDFEVLANDSRIDGFLLSGFTDESDIRTTIEKIKQKGEYEIDLECEDYEMIMSLSDVIDIFVVSYNETFSEILEKKPDNIFAYKVFHKDGVENPTSIEALAIRDIIFSDYKYGALFYEDQ